MGTKFSSTVTSQTPFDEFLDDLSLTPEISIGFNLAGMGFKITTGGSWELTFGPFTIGMDPGFPAGNGEIHTSGAPTEVYATLPLSGALDLKSDYNYGFTATFEIERQTPDHAPWASLITVSFSATILHHWLIVPLIGGSEFADTSFTFSQSLQYVQSGVFPSKPVYDEFFGPGIFCPYNSPTCHYWGTYYNWN